MERNFFVEEFVNPFKIYFRLFLLSLIRSLFMMHYKWVRRRFIGVLKLKVMKISKHNCNKPHRFCVMSMLIFSVFLLALFNEQTNKQMKSKSYLRRMYSLICQAAGRYFNRLASMGKSIIVLKIRNWESYLHEFSNVLLIIHLIFTHLMMRVSKLIEFATKFFNVIRKSDCNRSFEFLWNDWISSNWLWNFWTLQINFTTKSWLIPLNLNNSSLHTKCNKKLTSIFMKYSFCISG